MRNNDYIEGLMRSLTPDQKAQIREHYDAEDAEYVTIHVSVFNAGHTISLTFSAEPQGFDPETWNGYTLHDTPLEDVITLLDRYGL